MSNQQSPANSGAITAQYCTTVKQHRSKCCPCSTGLKKWSATDSVRVDNINSTAAYCKATGKAPMRNPASLVMRMKRTLAYISRI
jgi:hypothetical protein